MKVKLAFLQSAVQVPGFLASETTLSAQKIKGLEMQYLPQGLMLIVKRDGKEVVHAIVPHTNVKVAVLAEIQTLEEVPAPKAKKSS